MSRFREPQHPDFHRLNASISFDQRLWPQDIAQSRAHARMLTEREIVSAADLQALLAGLDAVEAELRDDHFAFAAADEDIHMPFREAHGVVAGIVRTAVDAGKPLSALTDEELRSQSELLGAHTHEFHQVLESSSWLESKVSEGGTSSVRVAEQLALAQTVLDAGPEG